MMSLESDHFLEVVLEKFQEELENGHVTRIMITGYEAAMPLALMPKGV